jgi:hypothetical protein
MDLAAALERHTHFQQHYTAAWYPQRQDTAAYCAMAI